MKDVEIDIFDYRDVQSKTANLIAYLDDLEEKANQICERLASVGAVRASLGFSRAIYNGTNDVAISVEPIQGGYAIHARGNAVLFIEFGSGAKHGYGHPEPDGYGPGTYNPGSDNWQNPKGWWYGNGEHTFGNPPAQAMYDAKQEIINVIEQVANEVFNS